MRKRREFRGAWATLTYDRARKQHCASAAPTPGHEEREPAADRDHRRSAPSPHVNFDNRVVEQDIEYDWLGNTDIWAESEPNRLRIAMRHAVEQLRQRSSVALPRLI